MSPRRLDRSLRVVAAGFGALAVLVLVGGLLIPLETVSLTQRATHLSTTRPSGVGSNAPTPESFGNALTRPLRPSLVDAPPVADTARTSPGPAVSAEQMKLVGTVGESVAMIQGPKGQIVLVEVGDDLEGMLVTAIRERMVELQQGNRVIRLEKPKSPAPLDAEISAR